MSRNAPQFRVQAEEITSQGRGGKYLPAGIRQASSCAPKRRSRLRTMGSGSSSVTKVLIASQRLSRLHRHQ